MQKFNQSINKSVIYLF